MHFDDGPALGVNREHVELDLALADPGQAGVAPERASVGLAVELHGPDPVREEESVQGLAEGAQRRALEHSVQEGGVEGVAQELVLELLGRHDFGQDLARGLREVELRDPLEALAELEAGLGHARVEASGVEGRRDAGADLLEVELAGGEGVDRVQAPPGVDGPALPGRVGDRAPRADLEVTLVAVDLEPELRRVALGRERDREPEHDVFEVVLARPPSHDPRRVAGLELASAWEHDQALDVVVEEVGLGDGVHAQARRETSLGDGARDRPADRRVSQAAPALEGGLGRLEPVGLALEGIAREGQRHPRQVLGDWSAGDVR